MQYNETGGIEAVKKITAEKSKDPVLSAINERLDKYKKTHVILNNNTGQSHAGGGKSKKTFKTMKKRRLKR